MSNQIFYPSYFGLWIIKSFSGHLKENMLFPVSFRYLEMAKKILDIF